MLETFWQAIEARDPSTRGHGARVTALAEALAVELGWDEVRLEGLRVGGPLHDVGKLAISVRVLRKPGPLSDVELRLIRIHPLAGARLIGRLARARAALPYVMYHHERWDGRGYPSGLAATSIPVEGRILAVADAYDAMTSTRPYRAALTADRALEELERCAGTQFDPELARLFVSLCDAGVSPGQIHGRNGDQVVAAGGTGLR